MKNVPQIRKAFKEFESVIEDAYGSYCPDDILTRAYFTSVGIADTEKGDVPEAKGLDFEVEALYEEEGYVEGSAEGPPLVEVKGIGNGMAGNLASNGVNSVEDLINSDPDDISSKISGVSSKMIVDWQKNAKALLSA